MVNLIAENTNGENRAQSSAVGNDHRKQLPTKDWHVKVQFFFCVLSFYMCQSITGVEFFFNITIILQFDDNAGGRWFVVDVSFA